MTQDLNYQEEKIRTNHGKNNGAKWETLSLLLELPYRSEYATPEQIIREFRIWLKKGKIHCEFADDLGTPKIKNFNRVKPMLKNFQLVEGEEIPDDDASPN